jgi:tRNA A-37 threonylcarbamoyl transferase component Bud32
MAPRDQLMIADRFVPIETTAAGIKARDNATAQTVLLVDVSHLDSRVVGVFHPALISVFAIVEHAGRLLAAAEFVQGRSLEQVLAGESCHPRRAAEIVTELADGVAELHAHGIVHGNITAASAVLTAKGKARLSLTSATGGDDARDIDALKVLLKSIGGKPTDAVSQAQSAAVLAAALRS